jgi:cytochrome c-type biogenesis protein CcmH/NrfG
VFYFYLFLILFLSFYLVLADKKDYLRFNRNIATSLIAAVLSLTLYDKFLSKGSFDLVNQKLALEIFLKGNTESKEKVREDVEDLVTNLVTKEDAQAGELYILARQLKDVNEFSLSREVYEEIYGRFQKELDGNVIAEFAQVLFLSNERKFDERLKILLDEALIKNPNNPSALTLKGLFELENNNISSTIDLWNRAVPFLNSEKERNDLKALIEAVKKRKNQ